MKEMAALQPGMNFYGDMPDSYNLTVNVNQPVVAKVISAAKDALEAKLTPLAETVKTNNSKIEAINKDVKDNKPTAEQDQQLKELLEVVEKARKEQSSLISEYAVSQPVVRQLIDLALLGNGLLKGADLSAFISRSVNLL
jgi:molecular chaperone HtpG